MANVMNVPEIIAVKEHLDQLKERGLVKEWYLPYENILTRLTSAIFFLSPTDDSKLDEIWKELEVHKMLQYRLNKEKRLSQLEWRVEFNKGFEI